MWRVYHIINSLHSVIYLNWFVKSHKPTVRMKVQMLAEMRYKRRISDERGKRGKRVNGGCAGMRVCELSGSKESWECKAWRLKPQRGQKRSE